MHGEGQPAGGPGDVKYIPGSLRTEVEGKTFKLILHAPRTMRSHPEFEKVMWDECLRRAHADGHMPVGPILIDTEDIETKTKPLEELSEGEAMSLAARSLTSFLGGQEGPLMKVTAEVTIGLSLA
jgi:hypothetical protein